MPTRAVPQNFDLGKTRVCERQPHAAAFFREFPADDGIRNRTTRRIFLVPRIFKQARWFVRGNASRRSHVEAHFPAGMQHVEPAREGTIGFDLG